MAAKIDLKYKEKVGNMYYYEWNGLELTCIYGGIGDEYKGYTFGVTIFLDKERVGNFPIVHTNKNKVPEKKINRMFLHYLPNVIMGVFE